MPLALLLTFVYPPLRVADWLISDFSPPVWLWLAAWVAMIWAMRHAFRGENNWFRVIFVQWLGIGFVLLSVLLVAELVLWLTTWPERMVAIAAMVSAAFICGVGILLSLGVRVKRITLTSAKLETPVRLVQISDVHIGSRSAAFLQLVVEKINALRADVVVITGDLVDSSNVDRQMLSALAALKARCYFSIGNHDRWVNLEKLLHDLGELDVQVLRNSSVDFGEMVLIGIDDADDEAQVSNVLPAIDFDKGRFSVLLYHRPLGWEAALEQQVDLKLSGHTHNGQIFPFNLLVKRMFNRIQGLYESDGRWLYVSPGTGTWGPTMRIGSLNEITCFDLCPQSK